MYHRQAGLCRQRSRERALPGPSHPDDENATADCHSWTFHQVQFPNSSIFARAVVIRGIRATESVRAGHPNPNALAELDGVGAEIWRTDQHGTTTIAFTDQGAVVTSER